jgi:hypothetical protein
MSSLALTGHDTVTRELEVINTFEVLRSASVEMRFVIVEMNRSHSLGCGPSLTVLEVHLIAQCVTVPQ